MSLKAKGWKSWSQLVGCWLFGGVFVWSGVVKALDPGLFLINIRTFHLLPDPYAAWVALFLPWLEILAGLAVISGLLRRGGLLLLNGALLVFAGALISAWARGLDVECGCFGSSSQGTTAILQALLRNAGLLALGLWLNFMNHKEN
jgi:putative oxidoreductase